MNYKGIDIYSEDNVYDWTAVKNAGIQFVYIKATEGVSYVNPKLAEQYSGAKSAGLLVGFYHFASNNNPIDEYNYFNNTISSYQADLYPALDYELTESDYNFINQFMLKNSNLIFYSSHSIADNAGIQINKQWIAEPETNPLNTRGYAGIQYTWKGSIDGINGDCDIDIFESNAILENNEPVKEEKIDMGDIIVYGNGVDQRYAESLADAMNAPTISGDRPFDYSKYSTVICVGAPGELPWTSYATKIIAGNNRIETEQMVLDFIKNGCK